MEPLIETKGLSRNFGENKAVQALDLRVSVGEIYGLVGPDGAGKTTTIRMLCGAIGVTEGEIRIAGEDMLKNPERGRSSIGYLAQRFSLYEELTVMENLRFFAEVRGLHSGQWLSRSLEILEFVGLAQFTGRRAGNLSGGMKQKLGLAAALVHRPQVLLLDEPTTGVDPVTRQDFWQLIIHLVAREKVAVLVSTPYMDEAARCMRLGFLRSGRLLVEDTPDQLRGRLEGRILELRGSSLALMRRVAEEDKDVEDVQMFGDRAHIRVRKGKDARVLKKLPKRLKASGMSDFSLAACDATLEDVFIDLQRVEAV